jgi:putative DNA primase/helicase
MARPDYDLINDRFPASAVLKQYGINVVNRTFKCPLHDDHTNSGSIYTGRNGRERWRCHACDKEGDSLDLVREIEGCTQQEAMRKLTGQDPAFRPPPEPERKKLPPTPVYDLALIPFDVVSKIRPGAKTPEVLHKSGKRFGYVPKLVHVYTDAAGQVPLVILRYTRPDGSKAFTPLRWCRHHNALVATAWKEGERRLLYREPELAARPHAPVLVVEGEKCAELLGSLPAFDDFVVVAWHGGAQQVERQPWDLLQGRKVVLWPDADPPKDGQEDGAGLKAMRKVAVLVQPAQVAIVEPLQAWIDQDIGFDAFDLVASLGGDGRAAREQMENVVVPWRPIRPPTPPPGGPGGGGGGGSRYLLNKDGGLASTDELNWREFLMSPDFGRQLSFDVLDNVTLIDGEPLDDYGLDQLSMEMSRQAGFRGVKPHKVGGYLTTLAKRQPVNRLADRLRALTWDGTPRHLLAYAGAPVEPGSWPRKAGWRWLCGLVHRILEPGFKHDGVLVLEGRQGSSKSRFFETIGRPFAEDRYAEVGKLSQDRDVQMKLRGKVVVELAEMTAHRSGEVDSLKAMLSARADQYRLPYAREVEVVPRTCVFGGTTNEKRYLKDLTGNRRYWIVAVEQEADIVGLERDLEQLLAEAMHEITSGRPVDHQNWLTRSEEAMQQAIAKDREIEFPQFAKLDDVLENQTEISQHDLWLGLGFDQVAQRREGLGLKLTQLMEDRGWKWARWHRETHQRWSWKKSDPA